MIDWKSMSVKDFKTFFSDFTIAVNNKEYRKMDYNTWKAIKDCVYDPEGKNRAVNFSYTKSHEIGIDFPYRRKSYRFSKTDGSFGQYSYKKLYEYEREIPYSIGIPRSEVVTVTAKTEEYTDSLAYNVINSSYNKPKNESEETKAETTRINKNYKNEKENKSMKFNFDFGPVKNDSIRMSIYGLAVCNMDGTYVSYDKASGNIVDVDVFNFNGSKFLYKMPVALKDVNVGDIVIHHRAPMFVVDRSGNNLEVVDIFHGENKSIIPTTNMFGFNFVTKVVSLIDMGTPNQDNPFGNMLPFLMMGDEDADMKDMAMAMMFMNGNTNMVQNPLMMMMLMDKDNQSDMLPMVMLMNSMNQPQHDQPIAN